MAEPRIVGLDPSLTATGVAPSNLPQLRITYTITTKLRGCERLARAHQACTACGHHWDVQLATTSSGSVTPPPAEGWSNTETT